jgi:hypothetical protein
MDFFCPPGRKLVSFLYFDFPKAAVFVGVGIGFMRHLQFFSDRIMRIVKVPSCVGIPTLHTIAVGAGRHFSREP